MPTDSSDEAYFIGYDNTEKRYVAHLMYVFGGRDSALGYGQRNGNEIRFVFPYPGKTDVVVATHFIWEPDSKVWHIISWLETPSGGRVPDPRQKQLGGEVKPSLDLRSTAVR